MAIEGQKSPKRGRKSVVRKKKSVKRGSHSKKKTLRRYSDVEIWTKEDKKAEDDDCIILTSDPLAEIDLNRRILQQDDSKDDDDVVLVAESGKVACRDYPHPRHTCAKYPFDKIIHEKHCRNCFCYICEIPAPCKFWRGYEGHCDATSANQYWSNQRKVQKN